MSITVIQTQQEYTSEAMQESSLRSFFYLWID